MSPASVLPVATIGAVELLRSPGRPAPGQLDGVLGKLALPQEDATNAGLPVAGPRSHVDRMACRRVRSRLIRRAGSRAGAGSGPLPAPEAKLERPDPGIWCPCPCASVVRVAASLWVTGGGLFAPAAAIQASAPRPIRCNNPVSPAPPGSRTGGVSARLISESCFEGGHRRWGLPLWLSSCWALPAATASRATRLLRKPPAGMTAARSRNLGRNPRSLAPGSRPVSMLWKRPSRRLSRSWPRLRWLPRAQRPSQRIPWWTRSAQAGTPLHRQLPPPAFPH